MSRSTEQPDVIIESDGGAGVKWFLIGALVGAGVAMLYAPQSGERTRRDIARRAKRIRRDVEGKLEEVRDEVVDRSRRLKDSAHDLAENVRGEVRDGRKAIRKTASNAREELERRLEDARSRRRTVMAADGVADLDDDEAVG
ncbi:MAG TPA: YtxH domain-containing protein [Gemmatimonadales bacterium]|nr:YtxH domain-containing protein [Gemmatimonadales bacterium]